VSGVGVEDDAGLKREAGKGDSGSEAGPDAGPVDIHQFCLDEVNKHRAVAGVGALTRWTANESCVDGQAMADFVAGRSHSNFNACTETGSTACTDWPGTDRQGTVRDCIQTFWDEGPGDFATHSNYVTLVKPSFTKVACGIYMTPGGRLWADLAFQ
jgi:hypothetical protein